MKTGNELRTLLRSIDHKGYPNYKQTQGGYHFGGFDIYIDHVQGDPFAAPSALHVEVKHKQAGFPTEYYMANEPAKLALQDYLTRLIAAQFERYNFKANGSGKSGLISITKPGQEILERSACQITDEAVIVRFNVGFPAFGRTINSSELEKILFEFVPKCIENSLYYSKLNKKEVEEVIYLAEDQKALRDILRANKLVSFVANGSVLPRKSGVSDKPMSGSIPFVSPQSMEKTFTLPHRGAITGMAVPEGITLIVGGGYHGKSTLLSAIQQGVYNHIAGDGRELVITDDTALKLRAEDGRYVNNVDISMFINDLPNKKNTTSFCTEDASGSTSQAAGVIEGMEAETRLLLIDEDTSATNFMVRDELMQEVISSDKEPITPFLERVRELYEVSGISTILVAGSSGAFFYVADYILQMDNYHAVDITSKTKELCEKHKAPRIKSAGYKAPDFNRVLDYSKNGTNPRAKSNDTDSSNAADRNNARRNNGRGGRHEHIKIKSFGKESFSLDKQSVNVRYIEQLVDDEQTVMLAYMMRYIIENMSGRKITVRETADTVMKLYDRDGFAAFCTGCVPCGLAVPRKQELYACINRYRG